MTNKLNSTQQDWENGQWVQLNVGLVRHQEGALPSARALFAQIAPLVTHWRNSGLLRWFFFMRKPPDVRLRFFIKVEQQEVMGKSTRIAIAELSDLMYTLERENFINLFFFSDYQPETERFGGLAAMKWVHQHFDVDTSMWLILDYLYRDNLSVIPKDLLLTTLSNDLFTRGLLDKVSMQAAWRSLGALIPAPPGTTIPAVELFSIETLCKSRCVKGQEADVLQLYATANDVLAKELVNLQDIGQLTQNLADIFATVAMFNFHRHGFDWRHSGRLIEAILRTL
ncbi:thiopeptide-type bacteriocin biosynthesis domain protein [Cylindrospermum stagnale PCC 7417]|uniref:Thiopeptide-type bacteriocin biosynthesis domain protein n=1 Tax=Cylindrospermum stagnale PCC 7417 TaxID=56107 RepID=K9X499_9NOST|nr:thiopeptide-type bacteriocin biosynthesis protein [Cylindrospermum stagnale]AFZ26492.1 thiopeptide-type bacteriocin biosynthesis domain protein [Cylindrospermum stagnale PCC 7417]